MHAKAIRASERSNFFRAANKMNIPRIAAKASCTGSIFGQRRRVSGGTGTLAAAGAEIVSATLVPAVEVVAGFGVKLQVMPAGGLLHDSWTVPPALPTALRLTW